MTDDTLRVPPYSSKAERVLLSGLLQLAVLPDADLIAADIQQLLVGEEAFYLVPHQLIYRVISSLRSPLQVDAKQVTERLEEQGLLDAVGGEEVVASLSQMSPTSREVRDAAIVVSNKAALRRWIITASEIQDICYNAGTNSAAALDRLNALAFSHHAGASNAPVTIDQALGAMTEQIDRLYATPESEEPLLGLPTGFVDIDNVTSGLLPGDLIVIAGRPSMGKTALALNIGLNVATNTGLPVGIISLTTTTSTVTQQLLCAAGRVDGHNLATGKFTDEDWKRFSNGLTTLVKTNIIIDDSPAMTVNAICRSARQMASKHGGKLGLLIINFLQMISGDGRGKTRSEELSDATRAIKQLARELKTPIILESALNRYVEMRQNKRPILSDLRESGSIENDADLVLFTYRDEIYNPESIERGAVEIILGKHRGGPSRPFKLAFIPKYYRLENVETTEWGIRA
ncbi:replicative DNA helicase [Microvirgula aerodenitrificans]|uniref:replicative DNA helicase n=1 Tax=Microvirgula aerodenitrificans TaxID=57480 RepID=UPI0028F126D4|nr:replicative DNA helicase [Microvirgula aerodenitrificans]